MNILKNICKVLKNPVGIIGFFLGVLLIAVPTWYFMESELVINNKGITFFYQELVLAVVIALLFGVFLGATLYKIKMFQTDKKSSIGFVGGFFGVLVSGCPACSITLASYLGLAGFVSVLPYEGLELKYLSVILLLVACYFTLRDLEVCRLSKK